MYNGYCNQNFDDFYWPAQNKALPFGEFVDIEPVAFTPAEKPAGFFSGFKLPDFSFDTLILLVLVYFLVTEEDDNISDTLLIIGVLFMLGF